MSFFGLNCKEVFFPGAADDYQMVLNQHCWLFTLHVPFEVKLRTQTMFSLFVTVKPFQMLNWSFLGVGTHVSQPCVPTPYHHHQRFFENLKWQKMAKLTTLNRWGFFRISMGKWTPDRVLPKFAMNTTTLEVECSIWMDIHLCVFSFVSFKDKYLGQIWWTTEQGNQAKRDVIGKNAKVGVPGNTENLWARP